MLEQMGTPPRLDKPEHTREERLNYCQRMRDWRNAQKTVNWLRAQLVSFENWEENRSGLP
jgi:hypothetical protein